MKFHVKTHFVVYFMIVGHNKLIFGFKNISALPKLDLPTKMPIFDSLLNVRQNYVFQYCQYIIKIIMKTIN